jgi:hypothetical protein
VVSVIAARCENVRAGQPILMVEAAASNGSFNLREDHLSTLTMKTERDVNGAMGR